MILSPGEALPRARIPDHIQAIETALRLLHAVGAALTEAPATSFDLAPLAHLLERAVTSTLDAYDSRRDPLAAVRDAINASMDAESELTRAATFDQGLAGALAWLRAARDWLAPAEQAFIARPVTPVRARELVASLHLPELHSLEGACLSPRFRVATPLPSEPPPKPSLATELEALPHAQRMKRLAERAQELREQAARARDARARARVEQRSKDSDPPLAPLGFTRQAHVRLSPADFLLRKSRELFEDVGAMGLQRTPLLGDFWRGAVVFDQRLLRDLDAFASLGRAALGHVERLVFDSPAKDASAAFALGMILGCVEGRDALAAVERGLRFLGTGDPNVVSGMAAALKLVPHPNLGVVLRQWLKAEDAVLRALAIDVLGHRQLATAEELTLACQDAVEQVVESAILHAAYTNVPNLSELIKQHENAETPGLTEALAWALAVGRIQHPLERLRERLNSDRAEQILLPLAIAGEEPDAQKLVERFAAEPTRKAAFALGFAGHPSAIAALIHALKTASAPELKEACAFALQRITGAELYEEVEVNPEALDVESPHEPPLPERSPPLMRLASDRRDRPGQGAPDRLVLPITLPEAWQDYLATEGAAFEGTRKLRRGKAYTPLQSLQEIDTFQITPDDRRILYREIVIKTGKAVPFDPCDFIVTQEAALVEMAPICDKNSSQPGGWGRAPRQ